MSGFKPFKTPKGTELPIISFKGKPYLQVAHRIVWFREERPEGFIRTSVIKAENDLTMYKAEVGIYSASGQEIILGSGSKREDKAHFSDHLEKAETGAIGRALAMAGYGTQFTADELDEGSRLADSPITPATKANTTTEVKAVNSHTIAGEATVTKVVTTAAPTAFKKPIKKETVNDAATKQPGPNKTVSNGAGEATTQATDDGWH